MVRPVLRVVVERVLRRLQHARHSASLRCYWPQTEMSLHGRLATEHWVLVRATCCSRIAADIGSFTSPKELAPVTKHAHVDEGALGDGDAAHFDILARDADAAKGPWRRQPQRLAEDGLQVGELHGMDTSWPSGDGVLRNNGAAALLLHRKACVDACQRRSLTLFASETPEASKRAVHLAQVVDSGNGIATKGVDLRQQLDRLVRVARDVVHTERQPRRRGFVARQQEVVDL